MSKSIYELKLHEILVIDKYLSIRRVPGGWIYHTKLNEGLIQENTVFIPFNKDTEKDTKKIFSLLNELYGLIWCEACYDPDNDETRKYSKKLLPYIEELNEILKFKT